MEEFRLQERRISACAGLLAACILAWTAGNLTGCSGKTALPEREEEVVVPGLPEEDQVLLKEIFQLLDEGNLEEAARRMQENGEQIADLFYEALDGGRYLFDGEKMTGEPAGRGLALAGASLVFYGEFQNGRPQGECTALRTVILEMPRYDYAQGQWKDGKMNGPGCVGSRYYEEVPEGKAAETKKSGTFAEDLMEGTVIYESISKENVSTRWELTAKAGVTQIDEAWDYLSGEYQLLAQDGGGYGYLLDEAQASQAIWRNLLVWEHE